MGSARRAWTTMVWMMPESSSRFAAIELGLGDGAGLEGRASVSKRPKRGILIYSDTGVVVGGGPVRERQWWRLGCTGKGWHHTYDASRAYAYMRACTKQHHQY